MPRNVIANSYILNRFPLNTLQMDSFVESHEESSSLHNESSSPDRFPPPDENSLQEKTLKLLVHLKDNRIFYFLVAATLLVFIIMMQIRAAYRSYDDNERLVKLWTQEKELKDFMSHKNKESKAGQSQVSLSNNINASKATTPIIYQPTTRISPTGQNKIISQRSPNLKKNPQFAKSYPIAVAGISKAQLAAAKRWLQLKNEDIYSDSALAQEEKGYYEQKYNISQYEQLPLCIVIPSHNNVDKNRHIINIKTIVMQNYQNYRIVFIDDASTDGTGQQVAQFLKEQTKVPPERYTIIKNTEQLRAMPNLRRAAKNHCKPFEIFMIIDGDDELLGRQVFKLFNSVFQKQGVWFAYSNFLTIRGNVGYSRPFPAKVIANNSFRKYPFVTSHLRAFYTQLFLNIKEEDLQDNNGNYLKAANDVAICIPILEQAHQKIAYIKELTYFYNSNTGQNNHQIRIKQQKFNDKMIRTKTSYKPLTTFYIGSNETKQSNNNE